MTSREGDERKVCPHRFVQDCPLYAAAHNPELKGCDDGALDLFEGCAVDRGVLDYATAVGAVIAAAPRLVAQLQWNEQKRERVEQAARNLRLNGIH